MAKDRARSNISEVLKTEFSRERIDMRDFVDLFGKEEVTQDIQRVNTQIKRERQELQELPEAERENAFLAYARSEALEAIVGHNFEESGWGGNEAAVQRTSKYDDIFRGADAILEFIPETEADPVSRIALAIDATMSRKLGELRKKVERNLERVRGDNGKEPVSIKYFASHVSKYRGPIQRILPVVVGIEARNADELIGLQAQLLKSPENDKLAEQMEAHPAQMVFLEQIISQLRLYDEILERAPQSGYDRQELRELLARIEQVAQEKKEGGITTGALEHDEVFDLLKQMMHTRESSIAGGTHV